MNKLERITDIALPVIGGSVVGLLTTKHAKADFEKYKQPPFSPPKEAFGIVWPILYTTMGIARTITKSSRKDTEANAYVYYSQLGLNYLWSVLYFKFKLRGTALIESYALFASVLLTTVAFYKTNKFAGLLLIPYVVWTAYATYLNAGFVALNNNKEEYAEDI
ncbi:putative TspO/MBR-related protein precursor [Jeotgalicoccus coquinae]|uniref:Tryptophan-rich sensory protein n=1 Tax=Jeotgalicoccus coquinae TaxID=709509 RepID=A0A6V7RLN4_9STAP|nr:TspO/MBR family protein [Jeotgalicoccus coquinae]MBB6422218.1 tryptophan-rich sensory protein [Jeotgalicoccus coquinae]GGE17694.1 putative TspO/MBR-related protein precursor [Jeotgalicoccus coquinae]CAD2079246.1 TspO/MBR family protein [Jeotgalicoccus coquinae]